MTNSESIFQTIDDCEVDPDIEEGFSLLFGGLSSDALRQALESGWKEETYIENEKCSAVASTQSKTTNDMRSNQVARKSNVVVDPSLLVASINNATAEEEAAVYKRAFSFLNNSNNNNSGPMTTRPPVKIVDLSSINNRGYALVATQPIPEGSIVFTERAMECVQIPQIEASAENLNSLDCVRACQQCFRSL